MRMKLIIRGTVINLLVPHFKTLSSYLKRTFLEISSSSRSRYKPRYIHFSCLIFWTALRKPHMEFRRFSDVDVLAGKGIIGHDPESRGADGNGFRFTLVGAPVRFSRHDGTWSTETSFLDESARRKSVNLVEIVFPPFFPLFPHELGRREHPTRFLNPLRYKNRCNVDEEKIIFSFLLLCGLMWSRRYIFNKICKIEFLERSRGNCEVKYVEIYI